MPVKHSLKAYLSNNSESNIDLNRTEMTIGRESNNAIVFNEAEISRRHARIIIKDESAFLEDLSSTNGTTVNGLVINKLVELKNGDRIIFGEKVIAEYVASTVNMENDKLYKKSQHNEDSENHLEKLQVNANEEIVAEVERKQQIVSNRETMIDEEKAPFGLEFLRNIPNWAIVTLIAIIFLVFFCLVPLLIIEVTNQWCSLFSGFFNAISPGVCL